MFRLFASFSNDSIGRDDRRWCRETVSQVHLGRNGGAGARSENQAGEYESSPVVGVLA